VRRYGVGRVPAPIWGRILLDEKVNHLRRVLLLACLLGPWMAGTAAAEEDPQASGEARRFCKQALSTDALFRSDAGTDLYNAALWMGGAAAVEFGTTPETRWTSRNSFDDEIRNGLRAGSPSSRDDAATASDVMLGLTVGALPLASIGKVLSERDCLEAFDMATDAAESITLTLFLTESLKAIAGRERPYARDCGRSPPRDSQCGDDRKQSFFSGHASLAGAGAGLSCAFAIKRKSWGDSATAQMVPCVLGAGAAVATGALRIAADKHWGTDVIVGLAVGATVGYFDTWGPFDLLRFDVQSDDQVWDVRGVVLPYADDGQIGVRLGLSF
jgi:hypothetical protein